MPAVTMSPFAWFNLALTLFTGLLLWAGPRFSSPATPLGVAVPRTHRDHPVVLSGLRRARGAVVVLTVIAAALSVVLADQPLWSGVPAMVLVVGTITALALCRRPIAQAKAEEGWYDGVQVRTRASLSPEPEVPWEWRWHLLSLVILAATTIWTWRVYPSLPQRIPRHTDASGNVDGWMDKSPVAVGALLVLAAVMVGMLTLTDWLMSRQSLRHRPDGAPLAARRRDAEVLKASHRSLAWTTPALTFLFCGLHVLIVRHASPGAIIGFTMPVTILLLAVAIAPAARAMSAQQAVATSAETGPDSPDDDASWKLGGIYSNAEDPAWFVPKRTGMGYTVNMARPGAVALMASFVVLPLLVLVGMLAFMR